MQKERRKSLERHALSADLAEWFQQTVMSQVALKNPSANELVESSQLVAPIIGKDRDLVALLKAMANHEMEALYIEGLPVGEFCDPPTDGKRPLNKPDYVSEMVCLALLNLAGVSPLSYLEEKGSELINEVAPSLVARLTRSNGGVIDLGHHTDDSFLPEDFRPEFLLLIGLVNESQTPTYISSVKKAFKLLSKKHQRALLEPNYRVTSPVSFSSALNGRRIQSEWRPLVWQGDSGNFYAAGNLYDVVVKIDERNARIAKEAFSEALTEVRQSIVLTTGRALMFNNSMVFHSRPPILEGKRWLQRVFGRTDLSEIRKHAPEKGTNFIFSIKPMIFL